MKFLEFFKRKPATVQEAPPARSDRVFSTDLGPLTHEARAVRASLTADLLAVPNIDGTPAGAMDSAGSDIGAPWSPKERYMQSIPEAQLYWYASQGNIGSFINSVLAQHWLVDKATRGPAEDAVRQGWTLDCENPDALKALNEINESTPLADALVEYVHLGRVQGGRVVFFRVLSTDPDYYLKPFNPDGVTPGSYQGMVQVDVDDVTPAPTDENMNDPLSPKYFKPTFFQIGNRIIHRSHLKIFVPYPVTNKLKPAYRFFGVSVPQRIYERVYGAERSANEAPQLAMTKRLVSVKVSQTAVDNPDELKRNLDFFAETRDNYGVYVHGENEGVTQQDTALTDVDTVIMTQYQIVAAAAEYPGTKLLGTSPKGFGASGEYEESTYRETLEGLQRKIGDLMYRHYALALRSRGFTDSFTIKWNPLDSPTALEWADINLKKATAAGLYVDKMIIDSGEAREALARDENSDFYGIETDADTNDPETF